jgi:hypothetical protein
VENRGEDSGEGEVDWTFYFKGAPRTFTAVAGRDKVRGADDGEFVCGERDRDKRPGCKIEPGGEHGLRGKANDREFPLM